MPDRVPAARTVRPLGRALVVGALVGLAAAALPAPAAAQQPAAPTDTARAMDDRLVPGTRVRISLNSWRGARVEGTIDSVLARAFVVDTAERRQFLIFSPGPPLLDQYRIVRVPFDEIETVEVSQGSSRWRGALRWGLLAAAIGAGVNALANSPERNPDSRDFARSATEGAVIGVVIGGTFGYLQGRERWRPVARPLAGAGPRG